MLYYICTKPKWAGPLARVLLAALLVSFPPDRLSAVGFRMPHQDPEAIARGDAFAATADNPSAIYYNPAGITQLEGDQARAGVYVISTDVKYSSARGGAETDTSLQPVPQLYYVHSFTNVPISLGLGIYAPYGLSLDWGNHAPFNTLAESGSLLYACINPVIACKIHRTLSVAIGPTINYSQATLKNSLDPLGMTQFKFDADGLAYGFTAGILWQPFSMWSFGFNYHSATTVNYSGTASQNAVPFYSPSTSSSAAIVFPQFVVGGISFRPTPKWNLEFDLDWTQWSQVKTIMLENTPFGNQPFPLNYRSSFIYEFGVTRQLGRGYFASVGYMYNENSSPDANFNPLIPDGDLQLGSIGFGHRGHYFDWAVAYHFAYGERTVSSDVNPLADGTYKTFNNAMNVAVTYKF